MSKKRVLFVSQEIMPYLPETQMSRIGRFLPQKIQEQGKEIRTFMPRYGLVNERRNQLHEVIRLSGMNIIIDEIDYTLIIKVASLQQARMQVYFIDNEDYFKRKFLFRDKNGKFFDDNDERTAFFARGVLETVKKLGWGPDVIHIHGWFTSLVPFYVKTLYKDNPLFADSKIVVSIYNDGFSEKLSENFGKKIFVKGMDKSLVEKYNNADYISLMKSTIDSADAVIAGDQEVSQELIEYAKASGKPFLDYQGEEDYYVKYNEFYDKIIEG
jgi:starch synthase